MKDRVMVVFEGAGSEIREISPNRMARLRRNPEFSGSNLTVGPFIHRFVVTGGMEVVKKLFPQYKNRDRVSLSKKKIKKLYSFCRSRGIPITITQKKSQTVTEIPLD